MKSPGNNDTVLSHREDNLHHKPFDLKFTVKSGLHALGLRGLE